MKKPQPPFDFNSRTDSMKAYAFGIDVPWGLYPCSACRGRGKISSGICTSVPYDSIDLVICTKCNGKKFTDSEVDQTGYFMWLAEARLKYKQSLLDYDIHRSLIQSIQKRLTPQEWEALQKEFKNGY